MTEREQFAKDVLAKLDAVASALGVRDTDERGTWIDSASADIFSILTGEVDDNLTLRWANQIRQVLARDNVWDPVTAMGLGVRLAEAVVSMRAHRGT